MAIGCIWDGTISRKEFYASAKALIDQWKQTYPVLLLLPSWTWVSCPRSFGIASGEEEGYLCLERFSCSTSIQGACDEVVGEEDLTCSTTEELNDDNTLVHNNGQDLHFYDLHIVYSTSYRVPMLYFRGYQSDGQPLASDDIEKDLPYHSSKMLKDSRWTFMTIEEHPYLNRPWHVLHPCGTSEWMKFLLIGNACGPEHGDIIDQYLLSWLSVSGQAVGLRVPLELFKKTCS
ncbi:E2-like conjugating enzyme atg10 [Ranunculus cassubicifolius]